MTALPGAAFLLDVQIIRTPDIAMHDPHRGKYWLFKHYLLLSGLSFAIVLVLFALRALEWTALTACVGGIAVFAFGVQKQHLEEVRLFQSLFQDFNRRYDEKNEALNRIWRDERPEAEPFDPQQQALLYDYFNLCGEEYLYYQKGFIYPEVWQAWKSGMEVYRRNPRIKKLWDEELRSGSYYDLAFEARHD